MTTTGRQRVAVITGASSGIGAALAWALAAKGWLCVLIARRADRLQEIANETSAEIEVCDVSSEADVNGAAARVLARHPELDMLVNNAGIPSHGTFLTATSERIEQVIRTNYLGAVWCARAFLPGLERAGAAHVVNVVSVAGLRSFPAPGLIRPPRRRLRVLAFAPRRARRARHRRAHDQPRAGRNRRLPGGRGW